MTVHRTATSARKRFADAPLILSLAFFLIASFALIPTLGIQQDEVAFAMPLFKRSIAIFRVHPFGVDIPVMLTSYAGTLKTLLHAMVFALWKPSVMSIRAPVVLLTAASIFITYRLLVAWHSRTAAGVAALLLATDPIFVLTGVFDWGPVVLQHFFLVCALWTGDSYYRTRHPAYAFMCGFTCGVALWDKALFSWLLAGFVMAAVVDYRFSRKLLAGLTVPLAVAGLFAGASPLIIYNVKSHSGTISSNAHAEIGGAALDEKLTAALQTIDGSFLFHYLVRTEGNGATVQAKSPVAHVSDFVRGFAGAHTRTLTTFFLAGSSIAFVFARVAERRLLRFIGIALIVAWLAMLFTKGTGASPHHVILLWPLPQMFGGIAAASLFARFGANLSYRYVLLILIAIAISAQCLVLNEYYWRARHFGGSKYWTDAIFPLVDSLVASHHPDRVLAADWGIEYPLSVLSNGNIHVDFIDLTQPDIADSSARGYFRNACLIAHIGQNEVFAGSAERAGRLLETLGVPERKDIVTDRNKRSVFLVAQPERAFAVARW